MQVVVDNLLTNYSVMGEGPVVLMLHGWGDDLRTFKALQLELSNSYKAVALDLPGFGQTQAPDGVWNLDNYADFVRKFLVKIEIRNVFAVIGHSNGGALAIRSLATNTIAADRLVLLASSGIRTGQPLKRLALKIIAKAGKLLTFWLPYSKKQHLRKKLYGVAGSDMLIAPHLQETFKLTVRQDIQADAKVLRLPTLFIYATGDQAVPIADGQKMASLIPGARLVTINGADHFLHHSAHQPVTKAIMEFIDAPRT